MGEVQGPRKDETPARTRSEHVDAVGAVICVAVAALLLIAGNGRAPVIDAAPPPLGRSDHGAAGTARNGFGGSIAPSPTMRSWPGTGAGGNGGPFAFIGAHYGALWQVPTSANNSSGVGFCVMEDVGGEGTVSLHPDPPMWDAAEMARAAALMSMFGGDRVVPYGVDASGAYDIASGEWQQPMLYGGGEYTRRRHVAVNFGVKMFLEDASPTGAVAGLKLARDTAVVDGAGGDFSALRNGYTMAQRLAGVAEAQHAVGGVQLRFVWATPDGAAPTTPGTHPLEVQAFDATGKPVGFVPIVVLSEIGIDGARTVGAVATVDRSGDTPDDTARWTAAAALGWPTMDMAGSMAADARFELAANPAGADVTDASGVARFDIAIAGDDWQLAVHTQAPTADVSLYAGTGIQGQVTWTGPPQSATAQVIVTPPPPPPPPSTTAPPPPPSRQRPHRHRHHHPTTTPPHPTPRAPPPTPPPPPVPPTVGRFGVRKVLDDADVQGDRDMSGFEFEVTGAGGDPVARVVTAADGRAPLLEAAAGTYTITEVGRPSWAAGLGDGGPVTFTHDTAGTSDIREVTYTNEVPTPSISTSAHDGRDGDRMVGLAAGGATIVDTVSHTGLVPGTEYVISGELMVRPGGRSASAADASAGETIAAGRTADATVASSTVALAEMIPTGVAGSTTFVPGRPDGEIDVEFTVPADSPLVGHDVVVYQQLAIASSGRVVAVHADPHAVEQTVRFADTTPPATRPSRPCRPPPCRPPPCRPPPLHDDDPLSQRRPCRPPSRPPPNRQLRRRRSPPHPPELSPRPARPHPQRPPPHRPPHLHPRWHARAATQRTARHSSASCCCCSAPGC